MDSYCEGCFYRRELNHECGYKICYYSIETGKLRGCPAGDGCIHKLLKSIGKRKSIDHDLIPAEACT